MLNPLDFIPLIEKAENSDQVRELEMCARCCADSSESDSFDNDHDWVKLMDAVSARLEIFEA